MMKKACLYAITLLITLCSFGLRAQGKMFESLSEMDGITYISIGKPMLQMAGSSANMFDGMGFDASKVLSKLSAIEIVTSEDSKSSNKLLRAMKETLSGMDNLEIVTEVNSKEKGKGAETVAIYAQSDQKADMYKALIVAVLSESEPVLVAFKGDFTAPDLADLISGATGMSSQSGEE